MRRFTNGEMRTYKECKRKWWLGWYRKLKSRAPEHLVSAAGLGTLVHLPLASYYSSDPVNPFVVLETKLAENRAEIIAAMDAGQASQSLLDKHDKNAALARVMIEGYFEWLQDKGVDQGLSILAVEHKVEVAIPGMEGASFMGKLDLELLREVDQAVLFLDHKTVGSMADGMKMLHMDEQMLHYHLLKYLEELEASRREERTMRLVDGALYNMLRKVKRTANATPPFYDRVEVRHNTHELSNYFHRAWGTVQDIVKTQARLDAGEDPMTVVYPNPTRDCSWKCEFFAVCPMFDDGSRAEDMLTEYYEQGDPLDRYDALVTEDT